MHAYELAVLKALAGKNKLSLEELSEIAGLSRDKVLWASENLSNRGLAEIIRKSVADAEVTDEAKGYIKMGMPEEQLLARLSKGPVQISQLRNPVEMIGVQWAKKKGLASIEGSTIMITTSGTATLGNETEERKVLKTLASGKDVSSVLEESKEVVELLVKRKLVKINTKSAIEAVQITQKGIEESMHTKQSAEIDTLTKSIILNKGWQGKSFKRYRIADIEKAIPAVRHPLRDAIGKIKSTYLGMGFKEVSGPIIEPSFWVFDALFVPQDHPAREMQDTFYLENPSSVSVREKNLISEVKKVHNEAWHSDWSESVAEQALLRTHTTSVSVRQIYALNARELALLPLKFFSVGRVFRNENVDYKHLADFYQTDGIIIGKDLTLANLFDTLTRIYATLGIRIRFVPSYFPFVEPGVEVQIFYEPRKEWMELGGAGIIRREITGITKKNISVLAWGLGVERILMTMDSSISSVSELYNGGVGWLRERKTRL
jgi:phenylalanyl-tRNA synthetase alpha chain